MLYVCSLSRLHETVDRTGARSLVTVINAGTPVTRPASIAAGDHLFLGFNDINEPVDGMTLAGEDHVRALIEFGARWDGLAPMLIHCWAGISRSTAAAYIVACSRNPDADERQIALRLRQASGSATPNARLVALGDAMLGRKGRMKAAIGEIGRGADAFEGEPFMLDFD